MIKDLYHCLRKTKNDYRILTSRTHPYCCLGDTGYVFSQWNPHFNNPEGVKLAPARFFRVDMKWKRADAISDEDLTLRHVAAHLGCIAGANADYQKNPEEHIPFDTVDDLEEKALQEWLVHSFYKR